MTQAKGILPVGEDRKVLYKNPRMAGYFVGVRLSDAAQPGMQELLDSVSQLVDLLVARETSSESSSRKGTKVAAVAVGFGPRFFTLAGITPPASFASGALPNATPPLSTATSMDADVMFYIASVYEARVNAFLTGLARLPNIQAITLERGYQRLDGTEPFGYRDGERNINSQQRPVFVFVHRDGRQPNEPAWADGGSYMALLKIVQHLDAFAALPDDQARDQVIGRQKGGTRLDLVDQGIDPRAEPPTEPTGLPPAAHVRKAGPRGHHDDTAVFRRGLPFVETVDGQVRVGIHFCSFQASLDQFDVVFNDWMLNPHFPTEAGPDALLDPSRGLTTIERVGFFFVPPYHPAGLTAALLAAEPAHRPQKTGRLAVHKRVVDGTDPNRRFERGGFTFNVMNRQGQPVEGAAFATDSTGRGICPVELTIGESYILREVPPLPVANVSPIDTPFTMDSSNVQLHVVNNVMQPNTPYAT
ncbi:MAG: Dyp-type peroxidase [Frankiaceae bacterium]